VAFSLFSSKRYFLLLNLGRSETTMALTVTSKAQPSGGHNCYPVHLRYKHLELGCDEVKQAHRNAIARYSGHQPPAEIPMAASINYLPKKWENLQDSPSTSHALTPIMKPPKREPSR
jgi:hypothetical protein